MASEGGGIVSRSLPADAGPPTNASIPGEGDVTLGPLTTAELLLPPDATDEVTLLRVAGAPSHGAPAARVPGLIIDDLRAE